MTLVVDASVATKWVLPEVGAEHAVRLRERGEDFIAPSLLVAEVGSAVWKRARRGELTDQQAIEAVDIAAALISSLVPLSELASRAIEFAIRLDHPIYDCFYLALAARENIALVTADARLLAAVKKNKLDVKIDAL